MHFLTQQEVDDRRARGFEERNVHEPSQERLKLAQEIAAEITEAFRDVKLGTGVGLYEAQAIDDYESAEERGRKRAGDEKEDWSRIPSEQLNAYNSSLSFFDAEGMRFHLPAFICSELRGEYYNSLDISLSGCEWKRELYVMLSPHQKGAVARFLEFLAEDVDYRFSRRDIEKYLNEFWRTPYCERRVRLIRLK